MPDYAALRAASPPYRCRNASCRSDDVEVTQRDDPDKPVRLRCRTCHKVTWPPKPGNESRRRDRNSQHRQQWRTRGEFTCTWCLVRESETRCEFHCDHIDPLEFDGADIFENTMMLCRNCHTKRHADQAAVRHLQGRSARAA